MLNWASRDLLRRFPCPRPTHPGHVCLAQAHDKKRKLVNQLKDSFLLTSLYGNDTSTSPLFPIALGGEKKFVLHHLYFFLLTASITYLRLSMAEVRESKPVKFNREVPSLQDDEGMPKVLTKPNKSTDSIDQGE